MEGVQHAKRFTVLLYPNDMNLNLQETKGSALEWTTPNPTDSYRQSEAGKHLGIEGAARTTGKASLAGRQGHEWWQPTGRTGRWSHDATFVGERTERHDDVQTLGWWRWGALGGGCGLWIDQFI